MTDKSCLHQHFTSNWLNKGIRTQSRVWVYNAWISYFKCILATSNNTSVQPPGSEMSAMAWTGRPLYEGLQYEKNMLTIKQWTRRFLNQCYNTLYNISCNYIKYRIRIHKDSWKNIDRLICTPLLLKQPLSGAVLGFIGRSKSKLMVIIVAACFQAGWQTPFLSSNLQHHSTEGWLANNKSLHNITLQQ